MADQTKGGFRFAIDRGGTFTDVYAECPDGKLRVMKLLSEDSSYADAPTEAIRRILNEESNDSFPKGVPIKTDKLQFIRMGTTVATNALLERKGERIALAITAGFKDLLFIGNQSRPNLFDLEIITADVLYEDIIEVEERIVLKKDGCQTKEECMNVVGITKEEFEVWQPLNETKLKASLQVLLDKGIRNLAVVLMHSYTYAEHENRIEKIAKDLGFSHVSLSSHVMPMVRMVPRGLTACADAYLTPCIKRYVHGFSSGFDGGLQNVKVQFMQSDGGLTPVENFLGSRAILSGPAGGVVGYASTTYSEETKLPVIGFDMGGTSTDVSRYAGAYEHVFETTIAGVSIQAPQLDINTVAAGGGSRLFFKSGLFVVGPESAGAEPGPVCYRKGGNLAVTDANLVLGRILPEYFPKIFGPSKNEPLNRDAAVAKFEELTKEINATMNKSLSLEEVAMGFIQVANEAMCRPIKALTQAKGHDTSKHILACFGGAGGQHACAIAAALGMSKVFIHKYAGILSAYGLALADVVHEAQQPCALMYAPENHKELSLQINALKKECIDELNRQGFAMDKITTEAFLHMRYDKTDCALMCSAANFPASSGGFEQGDFEQAFLEKYKTEFGFIIPGRKILIDDVRVRGTGHSGITMALKLDKTETEPKVETVRQCYFDNSQHTTNIYMMEDLCYGHTINGPAVIIDQNSTIVVEPMCVARVTKNGDLEIDINSKHGKKQIGTDLDLIQLSIFSHRFMSTAEQMGRVLQRTSISTNIKERLDFSCAMFGPDGGLVANAPHIPVHLGAMQETVRYQIGAIGDTLKHGDVILSNHPSAGGSHLPDLTVITPVFYKDIPRPVFFVASRGHHADIGGATPGSMPPYSKSIFEEGATFKSFKLVENGIFQEEAVSVALMEPAKYPGCSGTRNLHDNLSDLRAQVAANQKGIQLIAGLIEEYGLDVVQAYMLHIQENAELAVREKLKAVAADAIERIGKAELNAIDHMDDGSPIKLKIAIDKSTGSAVADFEGTGHEVYGNCNAPRAVTFSALIYCLRCLVGHDMPLNQGCLNPITVRIPKGSLLNPSETAAVIGGNVETSQRVVDVIFKAFQTCAASQGCMNNVTFGNEDSGYYETVAGGAGAGPTWDGKSGVHTHMTNTRITDPEILERRYPVVLQKFSLREDSGGAGEYHGGNGVVREILFRTKQTLCILTERRTLQPYGLKGGEPGKCGLNLLVQEGGKVINLQAKTSVEVKAGDLFHMETPGGGGYGNAGIIHTNGNKENHHQQTTPMMRGSVYEFNRMQESS